MENKLVLVTGGGSGIGRALCQLLAAEGADVIVADRNAAGAQETLKTLTDLKKGRHLAVEMDVSSSASVDHLAEAIANTWGRCPDGVVNNAGIGINFKGIQACTEEVYDRVMATNLKGTFLVSRKFALLMKETGTKGSIVNVSSVNRYGNWSMPAYSASKAGIVGLTLSLAKELAPAGIRVNAVGPGLIDTPMSRAEGAMDVVEEVSGQIPLRRAGTPEEVAQMCLFLLSDRSSYITASVHDVTGGTQVT